MIGKVTRTWIVDAPAEAWPDQSDPDHFTSWLIGTINQGKHPAIESDETSWRLIDLDGLSLTPLYTITADGTIATDD